jgi:hypothetical protein
MDRVKGRQRYRNALDPITGAEQLLSNIFGSITASKQAKAASDTAFAEVILNEQKNSDTTKILFASGIALAFIAVGIFLIIKLKKKQ